MINKYLMTAGAALLSLSTTVNAATLTIDGGVAGDIPSVGETNEVINALLPGHAPLPGFFGSSISAVLGAKDAVLVEVMGHEAGFLNSFTAGSGSFTSTSGTAVAPDLSSPLARWTTTDVVGGLLSFLFETTGSAAVFDKTVANGDSNDNILGYSNFFATTDHGGAIWLFFDDGGGRDDDDNHDDLVIRLSAVPVPAAMIPMLTGLFGLAMIGNRRRRKV